VLDGQGLVTAGPRPTRISSSATDGNAEITGIHWQGYGGRTAVGTAAVNIDYCDSLGDKHPFVPCAGGGVLFPVSVVVYARRGFRHIGVEPLGARVRRLSFAEAYTCVAVRRRPGRLRFYGAAHPHPLGRYLTGLSPNSRGCNRPRRQG